MRIITTRNVTLIRILIPLRHVMICAGYDVGDISGKIQCGKGKFACVTNILIYKQSITMIVGTSGVQR